MSDRIAEIEKSISQKKENVLSKATHQKKRLESISANNLGLTTEEKMSLTIEMLDLSRSSSQFDKDKSSQIKFFLEHERKNHADLFGWKKATKEMILSFAEMYAKQAEILRNEGISMDDCYDHYPFPELFSEQLSQEEIRITTLHRSMIAEELKKRHTENCESVQDIIEKRIIKESRKPVPCFAHMTDLYTLRRQLTHEKQEFNKEMAQLIGELYD